MYSFRYNDTVAGEATALALSLGYTHIDTAIGYKNQVGIFTLRNEKLHTET
jgi:diketogulonate reductase-like aldo/keto reductase